MRILANFSKKVATAQYENESYTVTFEAETEFNNVSQVADYLFYQAKAAVTRQISGDAKEPQLPKTKLSTAQKQKEDVSPPKEKKTEPPKTEAPKKEEMEKEAPQKKEENPAEKEKELSYIPVTENQIKMMYSLAEQLGYTDGERKQYIFTEARKLNGGSFQNINEIPRKSASLLIGRMLDAVRG